MLLWTTFASEQVDIDVYHPQGERYLNAILAQFESVGIRSIRLDAVGYAVKRAGTTCFMIPETFDFIADFASRAHARGIEVLVEIHAHYLDQIAIAARVDRVYDFALPPLVLHTLYTRDVGTRTMARASTVQRDHGAGYTRWHRCTRRRRKSTEWSRRPPPGRRD